MGQTFPDKLERAKIAANLGVTFRLPRRSGPICF